MDDVSVGGTLIWYYYICKRQVWLMSHQITPDQEDENVALGRFLQETVYKRDKKEITLGNIKVDVLKRSGNQVLIGEVKKTSRFLKSAKMQLLYYIKTLKDAGLDAEGELLFPKEKKKVKIKLTEEMEQSLDRVIKDILIIVYQDRPPKPQKIKYCKKCAYSEFCWS